MAGGGIPNPSGKPDFTGSGSPVMFGFYRYNVRHPEDEPGTYLAYGRHAIDNWNVTIKSTYDNTPPVANDDLITVLLLDGHGSEYVLENDFDPEGFPVSIDSYDESTEYGSIQLSEDEQYLTYSTVSQFDDQFNYTITDGELTDDATVHVYNCRCWTRALFSERCDPAIKKSSSNPMADDPGIIELYLRVRNEVLRSTENGKQLEDVYYEHTAEVARILMIDHRGLRPTAISTLQMMKEPVQNLLDGDGNAVISQALVDTLETLLTGLAEAGSTELQQAINSELDRLGSLDDYAGKTVNEAKELILGDPINVKIIKNNMGIPGGFRLYQNYPNPFHSSTQIDYDLHEPCKVNLVLYTINGQKVKELVNSYQPAGKYSIKLNLPDMPPGVYFYELQTDEFSSYKRMVKN